MRSTFDLRHAPWTRALMIGAVAVEFALFGGVFAVVGGEPEAAAAMATLLMATSGAHAWFILGARYELSDRSLRIVHGPWRRTIALGDIIAARPVRTLDRGPVVHMHLTYGRRLVLSPADRTGFLDALEAQIPHLQVHAIEAATRHGVS